MLAYSSKSTEAQTFTLTPGKHRAGVAKSLIQTIDGGYAMAGTTYSKGIGYENVSFEDFWLVKVDSNGNKQWDKTYGGGDDDKAFSSIQTTDGGYAMAGYTESKGAGDEDLRPASFAIFVKVDKNGINDDLRDIELEIHRRVNAYRKNTHNLPPLRFSHTIRQACLEHSKRMAMGKVAFSHDGFDERMDKIGEVIKWRSAAENVSFRGGFDYSEIAEEAVTGWINSPGHHKNIIGDFTLTGVGVYKNKKGTYYSTQIFIRD